MYKGVNKIVVLLIFLSLVLTCKKAVNKDLKDVNKADSLVTSANYEEALELYNKIYEKNPEDKELASKINKVDSLLVLKRKTIQYQEIIKIADSLFNINELDQAEYVYQEASLILPEELYPLDKIKEIGDIQNPHASPNENPYHLVVGVFEMEDNAQGLRERLLAEGYDSRFIPRENGTMKAVTYTSHPDIHDAYNNLARTKRDIHEDAWVLSHVFK